MWRADFPYLKEICLLVYFTKLDFLLVLIFSLLFSYISFQPFLPFFQQNTALQSLWSARRQLFLDVEGITSSLISYLFLLLRLAQIPPLSGPSPITD